MKTFLFRIISVLASLALLLASAPSPAAPNTLAGIQAAESNSLYKLDEAITQPAALPAATQLPNGPQLDQSFGKLPLYFVENQGQLDEQVIYYIQGSDKTIYFTTEGVTFTLSDGRPPTADRRPSLHDGWDTRSTIRNPQSQIPKSETQRWAVKLDFIGANPGVRPVGQDQTEAVISYFKGTQNQWHAGLPTYSRIVYPNLWPGIDLVYYGTVNQLKYEFVVQPGADPAQIRLAYRGADVTLNAVGQLEISTPIGGFSDDRPVAYQEIDGQRVNVAVAYQISDLGSRISDAQSQAQEFGFRIGGAWRSMLSPTHSRATGWHGLSLLPMARPGRLAGICLFRNAARSCLA